MLNYFDLFIFHVVIFLCIYVIEGIDEEVDIELAGIRDYIGEVREAVRGARITAAEARLFLRRNAEYYAALGGGNQVPPNADVFYEGNLRSL